MKITRKTFDEVMFPCYNPMNMVIKKAHGSYIFDNEGNKYVDLTSGIAVNCLGHTPEGVQKVIKKTCKNLIHVSNIFCNEYTLSLAKKLTSLTGYDKVFFVNSGAEANETALKLARRVAFDDYGAEKNEIISFVNSFHGRTFFSVTVGGQESYSDGFGPKPAAITHIPYNDIATFEKTISDKTCAVILEPIQGEGGIYPAKKEFIEGVRALCDEKDILLILDEIQCGMGRSGEMFAWQNYDVKPDIMTCAKALGCGVPVGAFLMTQRVADKSLAPGDHGTTYGGNPFVGAAVSAVFDEFKRLDIVSHVKEVAPYLEKKLDELVAKYDCLTARRGMGLMQGVECSLPVGKVSAEALNQGLIVITAGSNVLRFVPPLVIEKSDVDEMIEKLETTLVILSKSL